MLWARCANLGNGAGCIRDQALHWLLLRPAQVIWRPHQLVAILVARSLATISILGIIGLEALHAVVFDLFVIVFAHHFDLCRSQS